MMYDYDFLLVFGGGEGEAWGFCGLGIELIFLFLDGGREGMGELGFGSIYWVFLLKEGLQLELLLIRFILLDVDWVLQNFRVVHGAPADQTAMVGKRRELVFLNVAVHSLLNIKTLAHV